jgi:hypothetical protein
MEKIVPLFKTFPNFLSWGGPFGVGESLKQFEFNLKSVGI